MVKEIKRVIMENLPIKRVKLEVCCGNFESAVAAERGGAHRVELCSALALGGLTPSIGDIVRTVELPIIVHVLIRSREGDYCYTPSEIESMVVDIRACKRAGVDGVVIGALKADGSVDIEACQAMIEAADGMRITFHRAFDVVRDMDSALEDIIALGCHTILTSGGQPTAEQGLSKLEELCKKANGRIVIMAGSGITHLNGELIATQLKQEYIHGSCKETMASSMEFENPLLPLESHITTSQQLVSELKAVLPAL